MPTVCKITLDAEEYRRNLAAVLEEIEAQTSDVEEAKDEEEAPAPAPAPAAPERPAPAAPPSPAPAPVSAADLASLPVAKPAPAPAPAASAPASPGSNRDILDSPKFNELLGELPGATVVGIH